MSVLSKNWFALTASFPYLNFNLHEFLNIKMPYWLPLNPDTCRHERDSFSKYVDYTTSRFCQQKEVSSVHTLNLSIELNDHTQVDIIEKCIRQVIKRGVQELVIHIVNTPMYHVPNIFLSASRLMSLKIRECELPLSLMVDVVKFESLKLLFLRTVPLNDEVIKSLTTSFPLLETLVVEFCYGFKRFCIFGHQSLQQVKIRIRCELERIDIEATNLDYLYIEDLFGRGAPSMNLTSCKKLTTLSYALDGGLADLSSSFPFLEELFLRPSYDCKKLKLSSHSVKRVNLNT
ncbi:F-box domain, Leucine-rich repeat domain, L domain-like protein [Artemisia annua]|uniref:F-box domain, Leucine-rich repeat domain, L domain-like protein n=1 Tax=Artemisia annua TaxID=35608 RepID=A0A2U1LE59_ARTAN|nr:F-box domain, Leucine-rich repeat domain, L domain-like protein [Artemisia annua]